MKCKASKCIRGAEVVISGSKSDCTIPMCKPCALFYLELTIDRLVREMKDSVTLHIIPAAMVECEIKSLAERN